MSIKSLYVILLDVDSLAFVQGVNKSFLLQCMLQQWENSLFLKSLELYGFKSFADKTRLEFSDGITSLLGPNGCGKSNIVDAIKWVLGEQSTKTLRAGKMEDVIFNGTEARKALNVAEVTLVISNEDGLLPIEHAEVEIKRRLFRTGESEFYINRNLVRLRDIRELFFDTGIGKTAYSILEQGKIDQILSNRPEDRRYIFEEAAGITRYKQKSLEAGRKLERTEENIEQVETLLSEIKRQYDTRKSQASKVIRYRELEKELTSTEVDLQLSTIKSFLLVRDHRTKEIETSREAYTQLKDEIAEKTAYLENEQNEIRRQAEIRVTIQTRIQRLEEQLNGKKDQLELLKQRYRDFLRSKEEADGRAQQILERIERDELELENQRDFAESIIEKIEDLKVRIAEHDKQLLITQESIKSHDAEIEEREQAIVIEEESQKELGDTLQKLIDLIFVELDDKLKGYSLAAREKAETDFLARLEQLHKLLQERKGYGKTLQMVIKGNTTDNEAVVLEWNRVFDDLAKSVASLKSHFDHYRATLPDFIDEFIAPQGIITQKHTIDQQLLNSRTNMTKHREAIQTLREEKADLVELLEQYREHSTQLRVSLGEYTTRSVSIKNLIESLEKNRLEQEYLHSDALRDAQVASERVTQATNQMAEVRDDQQRIEEEKDSLEGQLVEIIEVIERENERISGERGKMNQRYTDLHELRATVDKLSYHIESINEQVQGVYMTFFDTYGKSLKEYDERLELELEDVSILRERLGRIKKQIQQMGYINHMAEEEFAEIKERYEFLSHQMNDLEKAKRDLTQVIEEIKKRSEQLFLDSYQKIRVNFQEMFHRMFGGGRAELRLLDPENVLESGIDILAQPPGKKLDRLAPLSGGEKSLTAVALLFATYKVKPSPFCILDEIDASLDDRNIGFFLNVLEDFSADSQFIIITHNRHTVLGSKTLLGVTMQERGISKAISYRMGWEADQDVIHSVQVDTGLGNTV